jgi:hypothetical protein
MVKALFPIGKTQWAKWGPEAREAFNKCGRQGFKLATAVEEANAVQAKVRSAALDELAQLGQEQDALIAPQPEEPKPVETEKTETVQPVKKAAPKKKAK